MSHFMTFPPLAGPLSESRLDHTPPGLLDLLTNHRLQPSQAPIAAFASAACGRFVASPLALDVVAHIADIFPGLLKTVS